METKTTRFEIARYTDQNYKQIYRLAIVKNAHFKDNNYYQTAKIPLDDVEVLYDDLIWKELEWGTSALRVSRGETPLVIEPLVNFKFRPI